MRIKKGMIIQGSDFHLHLVSGVCGDNIDFTSITNLGQRGSYSKMYAAIKVLSVNEVDRLLTIYAKDGILGLAMDRGWTQAGYEQFVRDWRDMQEYSAYIKRYGTVLYKPDETKEP